MADFYAGDNNPDTKHPATGTSAANAAHSHIVIFCGQRATGSPSNGDDRSNSKLRTKEIYYQH